MEIFKDIVDVLNHYLWSVPAVLPWLVVLLLGTGIFITARLKFIQLRRVKHAFKVVAGHYDDPEDEGDISHFQALATALSATVGIGNIAGVAIAIHFGGPGSIFWMWLTALFGMALKYAECTLALIYRSFDEEGRAAGGPMYFIEKGLGPKWKPMAVLFAVCTVVASFGGGNMSQSNTVAVSAYTEFGWNQAVVGVICAVVVGLVILGGIERIGAISSKLAPTMAAIYVAGAALVLILNIGDIPGAFGDIISGAFSPDASLGGSVAGGLMVTLVWGIKRGLFSNEAGQGSAPIAHSAAKTDEPVREGVVAMLGPLIDTLIICTMTALVIVITGVWDKKHPLTMPTDRVKVVKAADIPATGPEYHKVAAAQAKAEKWDTKYPLTVTAGKQSDLAFVTYDGLMDNAVLIGAEGNPFTGTIIYNPIDNIFATQGSGPLALSVRGESLLTSSALTAKAFEAGLTLFGGGWGNYIVTFSVFLFAISTMISWSYYGDRCVVYLAGYKYVTPYRLIYTLFVFVGAYAGLEIVWDYGDLALGVMAVPNLIAVIILSPKVVEATTDYFKRLKAQEDGGGE